MKIKYYLRPEEALADLIVQSAQDDEGNVLADRDLRIGRPGEKYPWFWERDRGGFMISKDTLIKYKYVLLCPKKVKNLLGYSPPIDDLPL